MFSAKFSVVYEMCVLVTIWPQRTSMLLSAFCSWCFRISGMHRRQNFMLLSSQFLPSTFLFPVISYFCFPPPLFFFSWAFTMLHFGRKSFHENQENCEIISQFTIYYLKGGRDGVEWSKTLIGIFCSTLHVFFLAFCRTCLTELCSFVYTCRWKDDSFTN